MTLCLSFLSISTILPNLGLAHIRNTERKERKEENKGRSSPTRTPAIRMDCCRNKVWVHPRTQRSNHASSQNLSMHSYHKPSPLLAPCAPEFPLGGPPAPPTPVSCKGVGAGLMGETFWSCATGRIRSCASA